MRSAQILFNVASTAALVAGSAGAPTSNPVINAPITFTLDDAEHDTEKPVSGTNWQEAARRAAALLQLDCTPGLLEATTAMVDAAGGGDELAMAALGSMYLLGQQCAPKRNLTWALHWLSRAEELGQPDAQALMGFLHASDALRDIYNFSGLEANRTHGRVLYDRAARGGSTLGAMAMAFRHAYGIGLRESCADSAALYEQAAQAAISSMDETRRHTVEQSNPVEVDHLTLLAQQMPPRDRYDVSTIEYMDYLANVGDVTGKLGMGHLYHAGSHGVPRDCAAAMHWFRSAAHQGDAMGHTNLGFVQLRSRRYREALRSLRRGTKHRDASAWAGLAYAHLYGLGVPQSDERAAKCMWLAARLGHLDSIYNLGALTLGGRGVPKSVSQGFRFLSVAAEFQHPQAQLVVGRMVRLGLGVRKDCATAQFFLKHAADGGPLVRSLMGTALQAHDQGRTQSALLHYLIAAHAGVEAAQHNAGHLYMHEMPKLRPEERKTQQQRAQQYLKLAVLQGSTEANVQLANLLVELGDSATAVDLYKEAYRAGSKDSLFHLGSLYWRGDGVEADKKTAFALWQSAEFSSKHAKLRGLTGVAFGVARFIVEFRAFLLFAAGLVAIVSTGGNPVEIIRNAMGGGAGANGQPQADWQEEGLEDEEDLFGGGENKAAQ
jgi:SEL1 protein